MVKEECEYENQQIKLLNRMFNLFNSKIRNHKEDEEAVEYAIAEIQPLILQTIGFIIKQNKAWEDEAHDLVQYHSHEIYAVYSKGGDCLYVGSGKSGRSEHCTSGRSHVAELNRYHFNNDIDEVIVIADDLTKDTSMKLERILIQHLKPRFNRMHNRVA